MVPGGQSVSMLESHGDLGQGQVVCWSGLGGHILMVVKKKTDLKGTF